MREFKPLAQRFAGPAIAAYFLHWGALILILTGTQVVLALLTGTVNWVASLFGQLSVIGDETVLVRLLPGELAEGAVPLFAGLFIAWLIWLKKGRNQGFIR
jgi:hypothetical protein